MEDLIVWTHVIIYFKQQGGTERQIAITLLSVSPELIEENAVNRGTLYLPITSQYGTCMLVQLVMSFAMTFSSSSKQKLISGSVH